MKKKIPWDPNQYKVDYNAILFKHFLPIIKGKAELLDDYLSDPQCGFHGMVVKDKIKFNCPDDKDPDKLVRFCAVYLF